MTSRRYVVNQTASALKNLLKRIKNTNLNGGIAKHQVPRIFMPRDTVQTGIGNSN